MLCGKNILSVFDLTKEEILNLFKEAEELREAVENGESLNLANGKIMATVFLEPSTRTKLSFQFAMKKLGGSIIDFDVSTSSMAKGESDEDTMRIIDGYYPDVIVIRQSDPEFLFKIKDFVNAPIINAGDGYREHPTQAILDAYTIWRIYGTVSGLNVCIMGDLKYGRTPPSLAYLLSMFPKNKIFFVSPKELRIRKEVLEKIEGKVDYEILNSIEEINEELDVVYVTRVQKERIKDKETYEKVKGAYALTKTALDKIKGDPIIMHPLPRVWELPKEIDEMEKAVYFEQAKNGMFARMALIKAVLGV